MIVHCLSVRECVREIGLQLNKCYNGDAAVSLSYVHAYVHTNRVVSTKNESYLYEEQCRATLVHTTREVSTKNES